MATFLPKTLAFLLLAPLHCLAADGVSQRDPFFALDTAALLRGEVHHAQLAVKPDALAKHEALLELDGARLLRDKGPVVYRKIAFVVDKPVGFFNHPQLTDPAWLAQLYPGIPMRRKDEGLYRLGDGELQIDFDSDDLSSVQRPRIMHAISQSKSLDPVSAGGFSTVCHLETDARLEPRAFTVANHVSLSATKTLVVVYQMDRTGKAADPLSLARRFRNFSIR